jgi:hypothetical protein
VDGEINHITEETISELIPEDVKTILLDMCKFHAVDLFQKYYGDALSLGGMSDEEAFEHCLILTCYIFLVNGYIIKNEMDRLDIQSLFNKKIDDE